MFKCSRLVELYCIQCENSHIGLIFKAMVEHAGIIGAESEYNNLKWPSMIEEGERYEFLLRG